ADDVAGRCQQPIPVGWQLCRNHHADEADAEAYALLDDDGNGAIGSTVKYEQPQRDAKQGSDQQRQIDMPAGKPFCRCWVPVGGLIGHERGSELTCCTAGVSSM